MNNKEIFIRIDDKPDLKTKSDLLTSYKEVSKKTDSVLLIELRELGSLTHKQIAKVTAAKHNERMKLFYKCLKTNGKSVKMALVAVMRKNRLLKCYG